jgi:hypothetical protein
MSKLRIVGATALSLALAVAAPAFAAGLGAGGGMHAGGGGGAMHLGGIGGGAMHGGGVGGAMRVGGSGGMHVGGFGGGAMHVGGTGGGMHVGERIDDGRSVSAGNFTGRGSGQLAHGGYRGDHDRHHKYGPGFRFASGLAAGSALGYGYGGSYDPNYYNDGYAYDDPGYDGYSSSVVSSGADPSYCVGRYQSYDPTSGTYLGDDGLRHPCP